MSPTGSDSGTGTIGDPYATPGKVASLALASGDIVYIKYGTYSIAGSTANTAGNRVNLTTAGVSWIGYDVTPGDDTGNRPTLAVTANSITAMTVGASNLVRNIRFTRSASETLVSGLTLNGTSALAVDCLFENLAPNSSSGYGTAASQASGFVRCRASGTTGTGFALNASAFAAGCSATGMATGFLAGTNHPVFWGCLAYAVAGNGFLVNAASDATHFGCVAANCTGASGSGFADNRGRVRYINCVAWGNAQYGFSGSATLPRLFGCATGGNGVADLQPTPDLDLGRVTLTADPFTNAAGGDFSLNNAAGGGAVLKGAGYPSTFLGLTGTSYRDIGAFQSQATSGVTYFAF